MEMPFDLCCLHRLEVKPTKKINLIVECVLLQKFSSTQRIKKNRLVFDNNKPCKRIILMDINTLNLFVTVVHNLIQRVAILMLLTSNF